MFAEILTIGDELCRGEIVDTNSSWMAERLWEQGVTVGWMTSCRDRADDMAAALETAARRSELVLVSGGLGPTDDDLTVDVVAGLVGAGAVIDADARERWLARYAAAGRPVGPRAERQLRVPEGARVHVNPVGAAPGFEVELAGTPVVCMPGVPRELHAIWEGGLADRIAALRDAGGERRERIASETYRCFGRGESDVGAALDGLGAGDPAVSIHYRVKFPEILVKLVVRDSDQDAAAARLADLGAELQERLGWVVYGTGDDSLAAVTGRILRQRGLTVACAESCTGGLLGARLTEVAGSSDYFLGGAVTYSNAEKVRQLGVSEATLASAGAVSEECVREMAAGIRQRTGADLGVAISGVAGPGGGTADKPVGTVWLAVAGPGAATKTRRFVWPGTREQIRGLAAHWAMAMIRRAAGDHP